MLEEWLRGTKNQTGEPSPPGKSKLRYILIGAICLGLLALIWPTGTKDSPAVSRGATGSGRSDTGVKPEMIAHLETILAQIEGAGCVKVNISLASDGIRTYASNSRDESREISEGGAAGSVKKTSEANTVRDLAVSAGNPLLVENKTPEVLGVLVVADGANHPEVCERLIEATSTLLNISPHQVSVMPRQPD